MDFLWILLFPTSAAAIVVVLAKRIASHTFRCRHCTKEFRISWAKVIIAEHSENEYMLVCPHCNTKDWCTEQAR